VLVEDGRRQGWPGVGGPGTELAVGEHHQPQLRDRVPPQEGAAATEV